MPLWRERWTHRRIGVRDRGAISVSALHPLFGRARRLRLLDPLYRRGPVPTSVESEAPPCEVRGSEPRDFLLDGRARGSRRKGRYSYLDQSELAFEPSSVVGTSRPGTRDHPTDRVRYPEHRLVATNRVINPDPRRQAVPPSQGVAQLHITPIVSGATRFEHCLFDSPRLQFIEQTLQTLPSTSLWPGYGFVTGCTSPGLDSGSLGPSSQTAEPANFTLKRSRAG